MRIWATLTITAFSLITTPAVADFHCPAIQFLPATLNLQPGEAGGQLESVQGYLANLKSITAAYQRQRSPAAKNMIANCLLEHLVTLPDNRSLLAPVTRADGSTWFLLHDETSDALKTIERRHLYAKPELPYIRAWLRIIPEYTPGSPYSLATR